MTRAIRFYTVGAMGVVVQLSALTALMTGVGLSHWISTALAVEMAVLHNFVWHQRWTWGDRPSEQCYRRLIRFHLTTGLLSIASNVIVTALLIEKAGMPYLAANLLSIAAASVLTYLLADHQVFIHESHKR